MTDTSRRRRGPSARTLWLIALGVAAVALFSVLVPLQSVFYGTAVPLAMLLGAGMTAAPMLAVVYPRSAIAIFSVTAIALPLSVSPDRDPAWPWPWAVPTMIAFTALVLVVTAMHGWRLGLVPWAIGNAGALTVLLALPDAVSVAAATADLIVTASLTAAALLVGVLLAARIRVGEELSRSRELAEWEQSRRALVEERTRIARELHDVVAHGMSVIQVQASTARYRIPELAPEAAEEFDSIAAAARGSLTEMRRLLGVLRTDDQSQELAPQQGIADITSLVESVRRAGVHIDLDLSTSAADAPPAVQITAFRIVQEALSNAVRHASGARVDVSVQADDATVLVRVHDDGARDADSAPPASGGGHGIRGMRERVALLDGTLMLGPAAGGGWTVTAVLPFQGGGEERT